MLDDPRSRFDLSEITSHLAKSAGGDGDRQTILMDMLQGAMRVTAADMGHIQLLDRDGDLRIVVQVGLDRPFLDFFSRVRKGQAACGAALKQGQIVIVEDVRNSSGIYDPSSLQITLDAGVNAVQCFPLKNRAGRIMGMLSMLYREPRQPSQHDLLSLDVIAGLASALLGDKSLF